MALRRVYTTPPATGAFATDALAALKVLLGDAGPVPGEAMTALLNVGLADTAPTPAEGLRLRVGTLGDVGPIPAEGSLRATLRFWATGAGDNNSGALNPQNIPGQPDGAVATITTARRGAGDIVNPVYAYGHITVPTSGPTIAAARFRVFGAYAGQGVASDTVRLTSQNGGTNDNHRVLYTFGTAAESFATVATAKSFDLTTLGYSLTWASLRGTGNGLLVLGNYSAAVVTAPTSSLSIDAVCVEVDVLL